MKTTRPIFPVPAQSITTPRLLLRPYMSSDASPLFILRSQPEVMRWTYAGVPDASISVTRDWMASAFLPLNAQTFQFVIEELEHPGDVIGTIGCRRPELPECGYMMRSETWGKGYATEALQAWLKSYWALPRKDLEIEVSTDMKISVEGEQEMETLLAVTDPDNVGSRKVLLKCGFREIAAKEDGGRLSARYVCSQPFWTCEGPPDF